MTTAMPEGWVYFALDGDMLKIGFTTNEYHRRCVRRTDNPRDVDVILRFWGTQEHERIYHRHFRAQRHRGEWFRYEGELKLHVEEMIVERNALLAKKIAEARAKTSSSGYERTGHDV